MIGVDAAMNQALLAMLPAEVRTALEGGAAPQDVMQSMLTARLQAAEDVLASEDVIDVEEPWPEVGWISNEDAAVQSWPAADIPPAPPAISHRFVDVARALGACTLCLGEDPDCPVCGGAGTPGWSVPEPELFEALVLPALRRLQSQSLRRAQDTARHVMRPDRENGNGHSQTN